MQIFLVWKKAAEGRSYQCFEVNGEKMISRKYYDNPNIRDNYRKYKNALLAQAEKTIIGALRTRYLRVSNTKPVKGRYSRWMRLKADELELFFDDFDMNIKNFIAYALNPGNGMVVSYIVEKIRVLVPNLNYILQKKKNKKGRASADRFYSLLVDQIVNSDIEKDFSESLFELFSKPEIVLEILKKNRIYAATVKENEQLARKRGAVSKNIVTVMLERYKDLYPETRKMKRHFLIHYGPTNSGKTYQAIQALKWSEYGAYLSPLRMLALEKFDELNAAGFPCNLRTGEEEKIVEDARYVASTIEMADFERQYDCAVIDECQMITDKFRGGAWTAAILGLQADEIHLCMSPWAVEPIANMIAECGDTIEKIEHKRDTELHAEKDPFVFPKDVREHDALILFSRKHVHSVAAELEANKIKCSVIYGNLPYDVRQNEARRFRTGETKVVVSTDAIGMGLNLPIKRVVFLQMEKFDGVEKRFLEQEEIRQIAGRAGRRGVFDEGSAVSTSKQKNKYIEEAINNMSVPEKKPMIGFPDSLIGIDEKISQIASASWTPAR